MVEKVERIGEKWDATGWLIKYCVPSISQEYSRHYGEHKEK